MTLGSEEMEMVDVDGWLLEMKVFVRDGLIWETEDGVGCGVSEPSAVQPSSLLPWSLGS